MIFAEVQHHRSGSTLPVEESSIQNKKGRKNRCLFTALLLGNMEQFPRFSANPYLFHRKQKPKKNYGRHPMFFPFLASLMRDLCEIYARFMRDLCEIYVRFMRDLCKMYQRAQLGSIPKKKEVATKKIKVLK
jgi:hypothetical protein